MVAIALLRVISFDYHGMKALLQVVADELLWIHTLVDSVMVSGISILMSSNASDIKNVQKIPKCSQRLRDLHR